MGVRLALPSSRLLFGRKKECEMKRWLSQTGIRTPGSVNPPRAASITSPGIAGVPGEVSRKPGGMLLPFCFSWLGPPGQAEGAEPRSRWGGGNDGRLR